MTGSSPSTDALKASVVPYTNFRIALASTVLGGTGVSLAWLMYLGYRMPDRRLLITAGVGALIGLAVHWVQHYVRIAASGGVEDKDPPKNRGLGAFAWALGGGFIALASEHLLTEALITYLRPFLASLVSLLPAAAIIGWAMNRGRSDDENFFTFFANGLGIGLVIAVVTGIIWKIGFGTVPWWPLISWWGLIGLATHLMTRRDRNAAKFTDPVAAVVLVFVATLVLNLVPTNLPIYDKIGVFATIPAAVQSMAVEVQQSPALPATFWTKAEQRLAAEQDSIQKAGSSRSSPRQPVAPIVSATPTATETLRASPRMINPQRGIDSLLHGSVANHPSLHEQIESLHTPEAIRSWIVILLFALGVGLAPVVEGGLRPHDYPNTETFKMDTRLARFMIALLVVACIAGRLVPDR